MKYSYSLKLENPCSEDWDSLQNRADGKYCSRCRKNIIDFTNLTNSEITKVIESSGPNLCGRVRRDQLDTSLSKAEKQSPLSGWYKFLAGIILLGSGIKGNAQELYKDKSKITLGPSSHDVFRKSQDTLNCVKGRIINAETDSAISNALLQIVGSNIKSITDSSGRFTISIPDSLRGKDIKLAVSSEGYSGEQIILKSNAINTLQILRLYEIRRVTSVLGGVVVVVRPKKKWWRRLF